jgi:hypothetical protein
MTPLSLVFASGEEILSILVDDCLDCHCFSFLAAIIKFHEIRKCVLVASASLHFEAVLFFFNPVVGVHSSTYPIEVMASSSCSIEPRPWFLVKIHQTNSAGEYT